MPIYNILSPSVFLESWTEQGWEDLCCWQHPPITYDAFLTGVTETYNNSCLKDRIFSDYTTQLYKDNFIVDTFVSAGTLNSSTGVVTFTNTTGGTVDVTGFDGFDSYWSANTNGSITNSGNTDISTTGSITVTNTNISGTTSYIGAVSGTGSVTAIGGFVGEVTGNASTSTKITDITNSDIVQLTESQTLTNKTIAISQVTELSNITAGEGEQLENIGTTTISAAQWGYLGASTGAITDTNDDVSVANLKTKLAGGFGSNAVTIGDSDDVVTIGNNLTVKGNTNISGTTSYFGAVSGTGSVTAIGGFVGDVTGQASTVATIAGLAPNTAPTGTFLLPATAAAQGNITGVGTISSGVWQGTTIKTAYIGDDQVTEDKLANTLLAEIDANTAKVTNSDQSKADINALDITEVGTISSGVWQGTTIKTAYIGDDQVTEDKLANTLLAEIDANTAKVTNADQSKSDIDGLAITTVGTIDTGVWEGTTIKTAYIGDDQVTEDKLANTLLAEIDANTAKATNVTTNLGITGSAEARVITSSDGNNVTIPVATTSVSGLMNPTIFDEVTANNAKNTNVTHDGDVTGSGTLTIADDAVTYAKMQNLGTADRVLGSTSTGVIGETQIVTDMIATDAVTEDKLANTLLAEIDANTAKVTNSDQSKADINALDITEVGTISSGVWNGTKIADAYLSDNTLHLDTAQTISAVKTIGTNVKLQFRDTTTFIHSNDANDLIIGGTDVKTVATNILLDAGTLIDLQQDTDVTGDLTVSGKLVMGSTDTLTDAGLLSVANQSNITGVGTISSGVWNGTDVTVAHGGTGVSTLTDGGILLGSGTGAITAMAVLTDGQMIVGDGTTDPVAESGATLRTSIGCNPVAGSSSITTVGTIGTGVWNGTIIAEAKLENQSGTNTGDETLSTINALDITEVGTISSGVWNGTKIADAYLSDNTVHLDTTQTISAVKTIGTNVKLQFRDSNTFIHSNDANDLTIAGTDVEIAATNIILDAGTLIDLQQDTVVTGDLTATGNLNISGTTSYIGAISGTGSVTIGEVLNVIGEDPRIKLYADAGDHPGFELYDGTTRKWILYNDPDDSHNLNIKDDGNDRVSITQAGRVGIGVTGPASLLHVAGTVQVGVDDTGHDVKFFGATSGAYMLWDQSADDLIIAGAGGLSVDGVTNLDNTDIDGTFTMDGTAFDVNATTTLALDNTNTTNGITINTVTSGSKVFIGHTTSETTVNDNLTVTGDLTSSGVIQLGHASDTTIARASSGQITVEGTAVILAGAQTSLTTIFNSGMKIGYADNAANIDFSTDNKIAIDIDGSKQLAVEDGVFYPAQNSDIDLGSSIKYFKDLYIDTINCGGDISGATLDISGNADIDGTTNLDVVDIDGAVDMASTLQLDGTLTVSVSDTGADVIFHSATANEGVHYDASEDELGLLLTTKLKFHDIGGGEEIFASADGHLEVNAGTTLDMTAPTVQINSSSLLDLNAAVLDMDLTNTSKITLTSGGAGKDLTIEQVGANDSSIIIQAAGTGADAIKLNASAGSIDIDSGDNITVNAADEITIVAGEDITISTAAGYGTKISAREFTQSGTDANTRKECDITYAGGQGTIALGDLVYMHTDGRWNRTDADAVVSATGLLGIALGSNAAESGIILRGMYTLDHDLGDSQMGRPLYLSGTVAQATFTAPSSGIVRIIGYQLGNANEIWFNPDNTWVELS